MLIALACLSLAACEKEKTFSPHEPEPYVREAVTLSLTDPAATAQTKALYANLWDIQSSRRWIFGHQADLMYGRSWYGEEGRSDTKDVCGDYPGAFGVDIATGIDSRSKLPASIEELALQRKCMIEAYERGMVSVCCLHWNNPLTGGDAWDNSSNEVAAEIVREGSFTNINFNGWLDRLANFANNLKAADGTLIPFVLRPFHEHNQQWSWWSTKCCTEQEFIALWRYTISYLRDKKDVHNLIYAISPQMDNAKTEDEFLERWPGDEWVDFLGIDCYQGINNTVFVSNLKKLVNVSQAHQKVCGVTETGVEGFSAADYWSRNISAPMMGRKVSMLLTWRNQYDPGQQGTHYFSVFPGHPSQKDFLKMYKEENVLFCNDLPDLYSPIDLITVE